MSDESIEEAQRIVDQSPVLQEIIAKNPPSAPAETPTGQSEPKTKTWAEMNEAERQDYILQGLISSIGSVADMKPKAKILIHSEPGNRKSTWLGTTPTPLIWDIEEGLISMKNHPEFIDLSKVQYIPYKNWAQGDELVKAMKRGEPFFDKYETFCIDTISALHKKGLAEETVKGYFAGRPTRDKEMRLNEYLAETEDHTGNNEHIRRIVEDLRGINKHVILTSHTRFIEKKDKSFKIIPDFSEKLANTLAGMMDVVAYVEKKEIDGQVKTVWWFDSCGMDIMAKNRIGLPPQMIDPKWDDLVPYFDKLEN